jgi:hypothetical protein
LNLRAAFGRLFLCATRILDVAYWHKLTRPLLDECPLSDEKRDTASAVIDYRFNKELTSKCASFRALNGVS